MTGKGKNKPPLLFLAIIPFFIIIILGGVFILRPPVVLVTDRVYDQLYGRRRGMKMQAETSIRLFRRVKTVSIAEDAGTDVAVFAIRSASKKPFCVLFPYRYYREAEQYTQDYPGVPAAVLLGRIRQTPAGMNLPGIRTDTEGDYFKLGRMAAAFVLNQHESGEGQAGRILFLRDDLVSPEDRDAFNRGLKAEGCSTAPFEVRGGDDEYTVPDTVSCVVLTGAAESFLGQNLNLPVLLVSWLDPSVTNSVVKVVFDDSPWAQVVQAAAMAAGERELGGIPSKVVVLRERIEGTEFLRKMSEIVQGRD
ncbi:MAG: hypothetical protein LBH70_11125 [Spirochaetaceae bacterium]|jgi:hypothetical protein|nr:hypothetical protein [Spirochaetaceae bacterium]